VTREVTFRTLVGTFMGGLVVAEVGMIVVEVVVVDWGILSKHTLMTKHMMIEPVDLSQV
jgi:hypothetical protein